MVARRMESHQGHGNGTRTHDPDPRPNPLGLLHSLTLDQIQNQLGDLDKPLGSMNLDELLMSVLLADGVDLGPGQQQSASGPSINRQPSVTLARDLSKKTVDEVWQDIQQDQKQSSLERNDTFSKMTLEDFLVKAGIVAEPPESKRNVNEISGLVEPIMIAQPQQATASQWSVNMNMNMNYHPQQPNMIPVYVPVQPVMPVQPVVPRVNPVVNVSYMEKNQMTVPSSSSCSSSRATSAGASSETKHSRRKRLSPEEIAEKSVQRRQKRMIKNRESAARSRARKQAYTNELENKISCLEEENERLKRQQTWEKVLPTITPPPEPKNQLRRTKSASF